MSEEQPANSEKQRGRPFQKGVSGNPSGRPKVAAEVKELAQQHTTKAVNTLLSIMNSKKAPAAVRKAAADSILDRAVGRPVQAIAGADNGPLVVQILKYSEADLAE